MTITEIARQRLQNQRLTAPDFKSAVDAVKWLGAVQAQDYNAAKWALGLRMQNATDDEIEKAFAQGKIVRTHVMRPTWHFVAPADIRWLLKLTGPRINALMAHYYRKFELDAAVFRRSSRALVKALSGGRQLTRGELRNAVQRAGIKVDDLLRFAHILIHAELHALICSGARRGKQFTYALLDERAPRSRELTREEALAELAQRYFTSHGPATLQDFVWWSGHTTADAGTALNLIHSQLVAEVVGDKTYWRPSVMAKSRPAIVAQLLPGFDEYLVAYKDRSAALTSKSRKVAQLGNAVFSPTIILRGQVVGLWKRALERDSVIITLQPLARLSSADNQVVTQAAHRYGAFLRSPSIVA